MQYEILYLLDQNNESKAQEIEKSIEDIISNNGGKVLDERWEDKRKLAYPVDHIIKGIYVARRFDVEKQDPWSEENKNAPSIISSITQELNLFSDVLRFVIVKADKMISLNEFISRKNEELKERKKSKQEASSATDKRARAPRKPEAPAPVKKPAPEKTGSNKEINEKLDEILNI